MITYVTVGTCRERTTQLCVTYIVPSFCMFNFLVTYCHHVQVEWQESTVTCSVEVPPLKFKTVDSGGALTSTPGGSVFFSHQQGRCSPTGIHHGLSTESYTVRIVFNLFFVTVRLRALRRRCRRWARKAHVHGGDVQRGCAQHTPLCHVLRPVVSERVNVSVAKFFH